MVVNALDTVLGFASPEAWAEGVRRVESLSARLDHQLKHSQTLSHNPNDVLCQQLRGYPAFLDYMGSTRQILQLLNENFLPTTVENLALARDRLSAAPNAIERIKMGVAVALTGGAKSAIHTDLNHLDQELLNLKSLCQNELNGFARSPQGRSHVGKAIVKQYVVSTNQTMASR